MLAPTIAWQTTSRGLPARTKMLTIAGLDVAAPFNAAGNSIGVDPASITVVEAAAGSVSRMTFTITDPQGTIAMQAMDPVLFWDLTRDLPIFRGWVHRSPTRRLGVGREIDVECIGIEAVLDWAYVPSFTLPATADLTGAFQTIASAAVGLNGAPLRWPMDVAVGDSTVASPVWSGTSGLSIGVPYIVAAGTLRQALRAYGEFYWSTTGNAGDGEAWWISVDLWGGLRVWPYVPGTDPRGVAWQGGAGDYDFPTISTGGPIRPSGTEYVIDAGSMPRTAVVTGSGGAVTTVGDGTGLPGPSVTRNDTNLTTAAQRIAVGQAMLAGQGGADTGVTTAEGGLTMGTFAFQIRPGAGLLIDDAQSGLPTPIATWIGSITKTWAPSGEETWRLEFGSKRARTMTSLVRRLAQGELA